MPRGRRLPAGDRAVYDVDSHLPGESQPPHLDATPIAKYLYDHNIVPGRQIAANRTYICYALKNGTIRVLNINTALRSLLRGHTQRVTDMVFFSEDVHLLASASTEGMIFVWKINEEPDEGNKPQITGKVVVAIQIAGDAKSYFPCVCWHPHKQEVLVVGISNYVLRIDTAKVGKVKEFSAEKPLICPFNMVIDGVEIVGKHGGKVTDLSMSQWMTTRLVSASVDGTIMIWEDGNATPLVTLTAHDGHPVNSAAFLTSPERPDHIVLLTAGPLNRELKIWVSSNEEGWLLSTESGSWKCTQTLELTSSSEPQFEVAFFNQIVVLSRARFVLLANSKKNTIYAVHVNFGPYPAATCMDYIADFMTMPIYSLTGTIDCFSGEVHAVQVFCIQTEAIQQYSLDLLQCLPPPFDNMEEKDSSLFHVFEAAEGRPCAPPLPSTDTNICEVSSSSAPINLDFPGKLTGSQSSPSDFEQGNLLGDSDPEKQPLDYVSVITNTPSPDYSLNSFNEPDGNCSSVDAAFSQLMAMQVKLNQGVPAPSGSSPPGGSSAPS